MSLDRFEGFACPISGTLWEEGGIRRLYQGVLGSSSLDAGPAGCCDSCLLDTSLVIVSILMRQLAVIQAPLSRLGDTVRTPRGSARAFHAPNACEIAGELG